MAGAFGGDRDLSFLGPVLSGFVAGPPFAGSGRRWNDTDGCDSAFWISTSNGSMPCASLLRLLIFSAIITQAARSDR